MTKVEDVAARILGKLPSPRLSRRLLMSKPVWRLSGLTYETAVIATTGSYLDLKTYISEMEKRMDRLKAYLSPASRVLDFGTGIGGNLFGAARYISSGVGIDVNPFFITRANLIARRKGFDNLRFVTYDGVNLPDSNDFDCFLSIGTFERLSQNLVRMYLNQVARMRKKPMRLIAYFLTEKSRSAGFGRLLGQDYYTFWSENDLQGLLESVGLSLVARLETFPNAGDCLIMDSR